MIISYLTDNIFEKMDMFTNFLSNDNWKTYGEYFFQYYS